MDKELLQRYVEGNVTTEEVETVVNWLDADEANVHEFMALHKLYDISVLNKPALANRKKKFTLPYRKIAYELLKIAAIFIILWSGLQIWNHESSEGKVITYQTLYVPAGQRVELTLPDSTKVWLNAKSTIKYPSDFGEDFRVVHFNGEAYFDVTHNKKIPFIVKTNRMNILVHGTEFNVTDYEELPNPEVSLLEGSIELKAYGIPNSYYLNTNERVKIKNGKIIVSPILYHDYYRWKEGVISFNNEKVTDIIDRLQFYYDIKIDVKRKDLLKQRYTGKFRTIDGVEHVLKVLQLEHNFSYTKDNELNLITIK